MSIVKDPLSRAQSLTIIDSPLSSGKIFFIFSKKKNNNLFIVFRRNSERKRRTHEFIKKFLKFDLVVTHINLQLLIRSRSIQYLIYFIKL